MSRNGRPHRRHTAAHRHDSVEFAELLDPIRSAPIVAAVIPPYTVTVDHTAAEAVVEPAEAPIDEAVGDPLDDTPLIVDDIDLTWPDTDDSPNPAVPEDLRPAVSPAHTEAAPAESRFADAGMDDDRLPLHVPKRRWPHR